MRIARFFRTGLPVTPWQGRPRRPSFPQGGLPAAQGNRTAGRRRSDPLADLLAALRGHQVTLLVGRRRIAGKLVSVDPVILVDGAGRATVVRPSAILAVRF